LFISNFIRYLAEQLNRTVLTNLIYSIMKSLLSNGKIEVSKVITVSNLIQLLLNIINPMAFWCSFRSVTTVKMNQYLDYWLINDKTGKRTKNPNPTLNPYYDKVICVAWRKDILINFDYQKAINNRLEKEGKTADFQASKNWFQHVGDSKIVVEHKTDTSKKYLAYQYVLRTATQDEQTQITDSKHKVSRSEYEYYFEGKPIDKETILQYMKEPSSYDNQGLENTLNFQVMAIEHIKFISLNGETYEVI
jgi:hypothetical protein